MIVDKFNSFEKDAAAVASYTNFYPRNFPKMAVTGSGNRTLVWFTGATCTADNPRLDDPKFTEYGFGGRPVGLMALEDKGDRFQSVTLPYGPQPEGPNGFSRHRHRPAARGGLRQQRHVGVHRDQWDDLSLQRRHRRGRASQEGRQGLLRGGPDRWLRRPALCQERRRDVRATRAPDRDLAPVPFPAIATNKLTDTYVRCGERGVGVGPDGKVYTCWMYEEGKWFVSGWGPDGLPLKGKYLADKVSNTSSSQKGLPDERKTRSAIIDCAGDGIRVDLKGNLYLGFRMFPKGDTEPTGFEKLRSYLLAAGSVVKFRPEGGAVPGSRHRVQEDADAPTLQTSNRLTIEGGLAMYPGLAPFSSARMGKRHGELLLPRPALRPGPLRPPGLAQRLQQLGDGGGQRRQRRSARLASTAISTHKMRRRTPRTAATDRHARHSAGLAGRSGFHRKGHLRRR